MRRFDSKALVIKPGWRSIWVKTVPKVLSAIEVVLLKDIGHRFFPTWTDLDQLITSFFIGLIFPVLPRTAQKNIPNRDPHGRKLN